MNTKDQSKEQRHYIKFVNFFSGITSGIIRRRAIAFTVAALLCCAGVAIAVRAYNTKATESGVSSSLAGVSSSPRAAAPVAFAPVEAPAVVLAQGESLQAKLVSLTPRGFDPEELLTSKGQFILDVENLTGLPEVLLSLETMSKEKIQTKNLLKGTITWAKAFSLQPGSYILTEANHPEWKCTITVTAP